MAKKKSVRVNARLDEDTQKKVTYLIDNTGANTSMVIKDAIHHYYDFFRESDNPSHVLKNCGFIGCADGEEDLSTNYKQYLTEGFGKKA